MNFKNRAVAAGLGVVVAVSSTVLVVPGASAKSSDVVRAGSCTASSDYKLKVGPEDGRLEVQFEVDSNRIGQTWSVTISDNGVLRFSGTRTTLAPSGSFEVRKLVPNMAGSDLIRARATNKATGEVCSTALKFG